jgi:hypothetical protein
MSAMVTHQPHRLYRYVVLFLIGLLAVVLMGMTWHPMAIRRSQPCDFFYSPWQGSPNGCLIAFHLT